MESSLNNITPIVKDIKKSPRHTNYFSEYSFIRYFI